MNRYRLIKFKRFTSQKKMIQGIPCYVWYLSDKQERQVIFQKLEEALSLIKKYAPVRFAQLKKHNKQILVAGDPTFLGMNIYQLRLIEIYFKHAISEQTNAELLASVIVHETTHARLADLGFEYSEENKYRIETLCHRSELVFGLLLPNGQQIIDEAHSWLNGTIQYSYSAEGRQDTLIRAVEELETPKWFNNLFRKHIQRKINAQKSKQAPQDGYFTQRVSTKFILVSIFILAAFILFNWYFEK